MIYKAPKSQKESGRIYTKLEMKIGRWWVILRLVIREQMTQINRNRWNIYHKPTKKSWNILYISEQPAIRIFIHSS